jgi:hypothetical protein
LSEIKIGEQYMPEIDASHIARWAKDSDFDNEELTINSYSALKTSMSDDEKDRIDQIIAQAQFDADPDSDVIDAAIIIETLKENGYHPAFEFEGVIVGQHALEALQQGHKAPGM